LFSAEEQWDKLQARLEKEEIGRQTSQMVSDGSQFRSASIHSTTQKIARVAAVILVAGLIGIFAYQNLYQPEQNIKEPVLREVRTANAQRANLMLGDGTQVMLNAGSVVKFPDKFEKDVREVYLEGEAYFDVVSNPDRPFVVHSQGSIIRVLGTSFSVRSYSEETQVRVVVEEGRVLFKAKDEPSSDKTYLNADDLGRYYLSENTIETAKVDDMELYLSWRRGYLKFRKEPMKNVAKALERRYGIKVTFEDSEMSKKTLTAFLKSRSVRNVLDVIAMSLDMEYRLDGDRVYFLNR
jgi:ferric-dicitrate binding protein FerR (iron transport regulator)